MVQVSSQAQLAAALRNQEPFIQITDDFPLTSQINILYDVTIESLMDETHTIYKAPEYNSYFIQDSERRHSEAGSILSLMGSPNTMIKPALRHVPLSM